MSGSISRTIGTSFCTCEITESIAITETGVETLADVPRQLFVKN